MRRLCLTLALAGTVLLAGCAREPARPTDPDAISMDHNLFKPGTTTIHRGDTLTFANTSRRALHILVPGVDARDRPQHGAPSFGGSSGIRTDVGDQWTSGPWGTRGTYNVTCTLHPSMNLTVVVT
ncbi:MAG: hypothetical protein ACR2MO_11360 [Acidimicrobiales bacterium]